MRARRGGSTRRAGVVGVAEAQPRTQARSLRGPRSGRPGPAIGSADPRGERPGRARAKQACQGEWAPVALPVPAAGRDHAARSGSGLLRCGTARSVGRRGPQTAAVRARPLTASLAQDPPRLGPNRRSGSNRAEAQHETDPSAQRRRTPRRRAHDRVTPPRVAPPVPARFAPSRSSPSRGRLGQCAPQRLGVVDQLAADDHSVDDLQ